MKLINTILDNRGGAFGAPCVSTMLKTFTFSGGYKYMTYENDILMSVEVSFTDTDGYFYKKFSTEEEANAYISEGQRYTCHQN
jgi:hypothetical protein